VDYDGGTHQSVAMSPVLAWCVWTLQVSVIWES